MQVGAGGELRQGFGQISVEIAENDGRTAGTARDRYSRMVRCCHENGIRSRVTQVSDLRCLNIERDIYLFVTTTPVMKATGKEEDVHHHRMFSKKGGRKLNSDELQATATS